MEAFATEERIIPSARSRKRHHNCATVTPAAVQTTTGSRKRPRYPFNTFALDSLGLPACPADFNPVGPFRVNIRQFLEKHCFPESDAVDCMDARTVTLTLPDGGNLVLLILEELMEFSATALCDQCRCIGWSHHPVSTRKYHFIILSEAGFARYLDQQGVAGCCSCWCPLSEDPEHQHEQQLSRICPLHCPPDITREPHHVLHGVIHSNGFGHLLRINAHEAGSKGVTGKDLMDLWDRLCCMLRARKVSVEDVSQKHGMDFRVLHTVAFGKPWYGQWNYEFGKAGYNRSHADYTQAVKYLRDLKLSILLNHFQRLRDMYQEKHEVLDIINQYQEMFNGASTLGYLLKNMMIRRNQIPLLKTNKCKTTTESLQTTPTGAAKQASAEDAAASRWAPKRLSEATRVILDVLKTAGMGKWVPRQEVRDQSRQRIGDTGLLDYVLKSIGGNIIGEVRVRRETNSITKVLEYRVEPAKSESIDGLSRSSKAATWEPPIRPNAAASDANTPGHPARSEHRCNSRTAVLRDIVCLYKNVLECYRPATRAIGMPVSRQVREAVQALLDSKHFIKDYKGEVPRNVAEGHSVISDEDDFKALRVHVQLELDDHLHCQNNHLRHAAPAPPAELIIVPGDITIGQLKLEAEMAFRDTYKVMEYIKIDAILNSDASDSDILFGSIESGDTIRVLCHGVDMTSEWRYEGGNESWIVHCTACGVMDDDGERMIACDLCGVWQHTRCGGIKDAAMIPSQFLCDKCRFRRMPALEHIE